MPLQAVIELNGGGPFSYRFAHDLPHLLRQGFKGSSAIKLGLNTGVIASPAQAGRSNPVPITLRLLCQAASDNRTRMSGHEHWMQEALLEAATAAARGEVPVGAVAVAENEVIARAHNRREETGNPLDHAEIILLRKITRDHGNWRFDDVTVYATCEPCIMCMGALIHARIPRLVFGCFEPKTGACGSLYDFSRDERLNHSIEVIPGVLHDQCAMQLRQFFHVLRQSPQAEA